MCTEGEIEFLLLGAADVRPEIVSDSQKCWAYFQKKKEKAYPILLELGLVQNFERNDKFGSLLSCEVHMAEFAAS